MLKKLNDMYYMIAVVAAAAECHHASGLRAASEICGGHR